MALQLKPGISILIADDDDDDCLLARDALREWNSGVAVVFVSDGQALLDYLRSCELDGGSSGKSCPDLILLDINMPRKNGREALQEIRADIRLRNIPIVILSTSSNQEEISFCHRNGANSFISKSSDFSSLVEKMTALGVYWFSVVSLPGIDVLPAA